MIETELINDGMPFSKTSLRRRKLVSVSSKETPLTWPGQIRKKEIKDDDVEDSIKMIYNFMLVDMNYF